MKYKFYIDLNFVKSENEDYYEGDNENALWEGKIIDELFDLLEQNGNKPGLTYSDYSTDYFIVEIEIEDRKAFPKHKWPFFVEYCEYEPGE